jgi:hypothetical protein
MLIIPAPGKLKQEDHKFKASLGYIKGPFSKQQQKKPHVKYFKIRDYNFPYVKENLFK